MKKNKEKPPIEYIKECFRYEDGKLYWKNRPSYHFINNRHWKIFNKKFATKEAGFKHSFKNGTANGGLHWGISLNYKSIRYQILRHQIVFALFSNKWVKLIDHKNRNPIDDRIDNLREATRAQNIANSSLFRNNKSGYRGVYLNKQSNKWISQIRIKGKVIHLGRFNTVEEAFEVYKREAILEYGEFVNFN